MTQQEIQARKQRRQEEIDHSRRVSLANGVGNLCVGMFLGLGLWFTTSRHRVTGRSWARCPRCGERGIPWRDRLNWGANRPLRCENCGEGRLTLVRPARVAIGCSVLALIPVLGLSILLGAWYWPEFVGTGTWVAGLSLGVILLAIINLSPLQVMQNGKDEA